MRLIDADALMRDINESLSEMTSIGIAVDGDWLWAKLNDAIEHAPTIEERKKGEWMPSDTDGFVCSAYRNGYRNQPTLMGKPMFEFCPVCGADMREEGEK